MKKYKIIIFYLLFIALLLSGCSRKLKDLAGYIDNDNIFTNAETVVVSGQVIDNENLSQIYFKVLYTMEGRTFLKRGDLNESYAFSVTVPKGSKVQILVWGLENNNQTAVLEINNLNTFIINSDFDLGNLTIKDNKIVLEEYASLYDLSEGISDIDTIINAEEELNQLRKVIGFVTENVDIEVTLGKLEIYPEETVLDLTDFMVPQAGVLIVRDTSDPNNFLVEIYSTGNAERKAACYKYYSVENKISYPLNIVYQVQDSVCYYGYEMKDVASAELKTYLLTPIPLLMEKGKEKIYQGYSLSSSLSGISLNEMQVAYNFEETFSGLEFKYFSNAGRQGVKLKLTLNYGTEDATDYYMWTIKDVGFIYNKGYEYSIYINNNNTQGEIKYVKFAGGTEYGTAPEWLGAVLGNLPSEINTSVDL
ncbi:hypothetical protein ACFL2K_00340 [Candidatus Margulisiibacteriota bacterium]